MKLKVWYHTFPIHCECYATLAEVMERMIALRKLGYSLLHFALEINGKLVLQD